MHHVNLFYFIQNLFCAENLLIDWSNIVLIIHHLAHIRFSVHELKKLNKYLYLRHVNFFYFVYKNLLIEWSDNWERCVKKIRKVIPGLIRVPVPLQIYCFSAVRFLHITIPSQRKKLVYLSLAGFGDGSGKGSGWKEKRKTRDQNQIQSRLFSQTQQVYKIA